MGKEYPIGTGRTTLIWGEKDNVTRRLISVGLGNITKGGSYLTKKVVLSD